MNMQGFVPKRVMNAFFCFFRVYNPYTFFKLHLSGTENSLNTDLVFVVSGADFQRSLNGSHVADKIDLWRKEVDILGLRSELVILPFSRTRGKKIPRDALSIEPIAQKSFLKLFGARGLLKRVNGLRVAGQSPNLPLSVQLLSLIWLNFLSLAKPKIVIGIGVTGVLLATCKELGIKTIEVQHGVFDSEELEKWWPGSLRTSNDVPDLLLTWDEYYSKIANELDVSTLTVGYPHYFLNIVPEEVNLLNGPHSRRICVVATLSCREETGIDPWGMINQQMHLSLLKLLEQNFRVLLRIHPVAEGGMLRRRQISRWVHKRYKNAELSFPSDTGIIRSLMDADIHLTNSSSAILEASYLGVPSLYLASGNLSWFPPRLIEFGLAKATTVDALLQDITERSRFQDIQFQNPLDLSAFRLQITDWTRA